MPILPSIERPPPDGARRPEDYGTIELLMYCSTCSTVTPGAHCRERQEEEAIQWREERQWLNEATYPRLRLKKHHYMHFCVQRYGRLGGAS
ncbi:unnamed protein product [Bursaphelenchus xylophilus]|uniref:(pine wood nematode) hypothetical protein n=1 Tax=Bursaphelenchus xylophilus TaxID=6326 RepID=A0A1I7SRP4_BURXY|nr:unnamed protein product [Bursaphelenchus xylophilus]CAG9102036.1 unnamed protein product [Bursaphelenchus xylophilus]